MHKTVKTIAIAIAALLALLLVAAGIVAATFNPNDYKPQVIRMVQEKTQRTLVIPGDISLSFFPKIGAELGPLTISERNSNAEFAAVERAKVSLALIPLLSKRLVVDRVQVDGLRVNVTRFKDGSTNVDDLFANTKPDEQKVGQPGEQALGWAIDSIHLRNAGVRFDDQQQARKVALSSLNLDTGKIASGAPSTLQFDARIQSDKPNIDARVSAKSGFSLDLDSKHYVLKEVEAELKLTEGTRDVNAVLNVPSVESSPTVFRLPALTVNATIKDGKLDAKMQLSGALTGDTEKRLLSSPQFALTLSGKQDGTAINGALTTPLSIDLKAEAITLPKLAADFTLPNPAGGTLHLKAGGNAVVNLAKKTASVAMNGSLDQSTFNAKLGVSAFSPLVSTWDIGIDRLDLDRYKSKTAAAVSAPAKGAAAEPPMDFAVLQKLHASGSVRVGALKVANIKTSNVRVELRINDGRLVASPLTADLYGGDVTGAVTIVAGKPARYVLKQNLTGVQVGPLLKDAIGKDTLEGTGNVQLDVTTAGADFAQIKRNLNGSARLALRDGAVRGVNIAKAVRSAKAKLAQIRGEEGAQTGAGSGNEKTDFSELSGSFRIVNGVAHNDDLAIKSPLIRVAGSGDIHLSDSRLDYLARTTVVPTLQGQGGPDLQALKGLTVPIRLSGPFEAINWRIDFADMVRELARQKLGERKDEWKAKAEKSLGEEKEKIRDRLKEQLKGVFGK